MENDLDFVKHKEKLNRFIYIHKYTDDKINKYKDIYESWMILQHNNLKDDIMYYLDNVKIDKKSVIYTGDKNIDEKMIKEILFYYIDRYLSYITPEIAEKFINVFNDQIDSSWYYIASENQDIVLNLLEKYPDKPWNWKWLTRVMSDEYIQKFPNFPWKL